MIANQRLYERKEKRFKSICGIILSRYIVVIRKRNEGIRIRIVLDKFKIIP
jgi:hypothetical protein